MGNSKNKRNRKSSGAVLMRIAGILLVVTAITMWGTSFLLAKYKSGGDGGEKARVAKFEVSAGMEGGPATLKLEEEDNGVYKVTLTNNSETAVRAELKLDFSQVVNKDGDFLIKAAIVQINDEEDTPKTYNVDANGTITVSDKTVDISPNSGEPDSAIITISFAGDIDAITEYMKGLSDETAEFPFDVRAIFTQID